MTFYRQRRNSGEEITTLLARGAIEQAGDLAHGIKGSSGYLGAWRLYHEAAAMEEACETGDADAAMEQLKRFRLSLDEVIGGLEGLEEDSATNLPEAP